MEITIKDIEKLKEDITSCDLVVEEFDTGNDAGYDCKQVRKILDDFIYTQNKTNKSSLLNCT